MADSLNPLWLSHFTATSGIGRGLPETLGALRERRGGLAPCAFDTVDLPTFVGEVAGVDAVQLPGQLAAFDCRNNRLAFLGLMQDGFADAVAAAVRKHGSQRVGIFLGTSTSGILQTELAYRRRDPTDGALPADFDYDSTHNTFSVADFARRCLGLAGPAVVVSSACSSSAKVFASARRMMAAGLIDAAVVGGVDSLCLTTLYGFNSLGLMSTQACRPFDVARDGISIGEAAAFALIERVPEHLDPDAVLLLGVGESSDAYHMSSPHPDGLGARIAMQNALATAQLDAADIDYINLHGTATPSNDRGRNQGCRGSVRFGHAVQFHQRRDRAHAGRGGWPGGRDLRAGAAERPVAGRTEHAATRPDPAVELPAGEPQSTGPSHPQQFLRFWRHQLQPDFRPRRLNAA